LREKTEPEGPCPIAAGGGVYQTGPREERKKKVSKGKSMPIWKKEVVKEDGPSLLKHLGLRWENAPAPKQGGDEGHRPSASKKKKRRVVARKTL